MSPLRKKLVIVVVIAGLVSAVNYYFFGLSSSLFLGLSIFFGEQTVSFLKELFDVKPDRFSSRSELELDLGAVIMPFVLLIWLALIVLSYVQGISYPLIIAGICCITSTYDSLRGMIENRQKTGRYFLTAKVLKTTIKTDDSTAEQLKA